LARTVAASPRTVSARAGRRPDAGLTRYAWLSIGAAIATIVLKGLAWFVTGSVGLLSDALESLVNLAGALMALAMLSIAAQPADLDHPHGHGKAEYFSSAFEGALIFVAAVGIAYSAVERLLDPRPLEALGPGLALSVVSTLINFATARILLSVGRKFRAITLEADAHHLLTDVWTSVGVVAGIALVWATGRLWIDPVVALIVAANILWTGWKLLRRSAAGLMDVALPDGEVDAIRAALSAFEPRGIQFHALRTRQAGARAFVTVHVLVPGDWTVQTGHDWAERIELAIRERLPHVHVTTHLEPKEDPVSFDDEGLER
jgi:cation diffusion facilitator family transporter